MLVYNWETEEYGPHLKRALVLVDGITSSSDSSGR